MDKDCTNCPGATDHDTANCPLMATGRARRDNIVGMRAKINLQADLIARLESRVAKQRETIRYQDAVIEQRNSELSQRFSEMEQLRADAERYRWLRDPERVPDDRPFGHLAVGELEGEDVHFGQTLDQIIDLHMEHHPGEVDDSTD